jgi:hypothetical protein
MRVGSLTRFLLYTSLAPTASVSRPRQPLYLHPPPHLPRACGREPYELLDLIVEHKLCRDD